MWCDATDYEPVTATLPAAVSSVRGVAFEDLESLSRRVDPDALNAIVDHWTERDIRGRRTMSFPFGDSAVTVHTDGEIVIDPEQPLECDA
ncbi:HalOD1 output domain-containing protein [Natronolimnohabitans sp. A-GB9]|uniref:HalOD1 output domain-containing protein n=1 Tax=Natronolimnohabitans sp. A-GB9 TaxID=3069757 RepID=UPI0027AE3682|nr:HalOD1 output domain-containing protein [Natronolimnohabitans sp. A-GB9]MDQ2049874.1 HalOD1 output domain-containing protein [Natronolimnohabitans sp. A-GB9]